MSSAFVSARPDSASICLPSSTLVPSIRTTTGSRRPSFRMAAMTPAASRSQRRMPPKTLMNTVFTLGSDERIRNAFSICSGEAPPPTSRKFAGSPPASFTMSIVAIARPAPRLKILDAERRMRPLPDDLVGRARGDLLDVHAAGLGRHDHVGRAGPVERDREIELPRDGRGLLHEHRADLDPARRRLRALEAHAEDLARGALGALRVVRHLDAAGLAAAAGVHLGLHDDPAAQARGGRLRVGGRRGDLAARNGHAELAQEGFGLVFVDFHGSGGLEDGFDPGWPESCAAWLRHAR